MNFGFSPNQFHSISLDFKILCAIQPNYKRSYTLHERDMEKLLMSVENSEQKLIHSTAESAPKIPGRREFFTYRDLRANEASLGKMNAQTMTAIKGMTKPTGWHYHDCECQFLYILQGWIDMEFETGDRYHIREGESLYIPGGMIHNETATSEDMEILEISIPSIARTVPCDPPK